MVIARKSQNGFTLVEISIVLVIIGLIVGAILVGRDLIRASQLRGLVSEVEELKTAVNTFKLKYGQLPGDMSISVTPQLGFLTFADALAGISYGNNDGLITNGGNNYEASCGFESSVMFYHLAQANLIKMGTQTTLKTAPGPGWTGEPLGETDSTPITLSKYLPESKVGGAFFCGGELNTSSVVAATNLNYKSNTFSLRGLTTISHLSWAEPSLSPIDLLSIDKKIDDGTPLKGKVIANYFSNPIYYVGPLWATGKVCTVLVIPGGWPWDDQTYNATPANGGNEIACLPIFIW